MHSQLIVEQLHKLPMNSISWPRANLVNNQEEEVIRENEKLRFLISNQFTLFYDNTLRLPNDEFIYRC